MSPADASWRWWQVASCAAGAAVVAGTVLGPLDAAGRRDGLAAHVAQHLLLGDVAPLLLALGAPPRVRRGVRVGLERAATSQRRAPRTVALLTSPAVAFVLWVLITYVWFIPPLHRAAVPAGAVHALDHASFLAVGLLLALALFDPRPSHPFGVALRRGGLPWWGRHAYSMTSRVFMLPPAVVVAFSPGYHLDPASGSRDERLDAASVMVGFEMVLFALSFVLAFLFLAVAEGRRQSG